MADNGSKPSIGGYPDNLRNHLLRGHKKLDDDHASAEKDRLGNFRVGSSGCFTAEGQVFGVCPRKAYLRCVKGIDESADLGVKVMWQGGEANELIWSQILTAAEVPHKADHNCVYEDPEGWRLTGRPDIILNNSEGAPTCILELKSLHATRSAGVVFCLNKPETKHIIQLATYMWMTGLPGKLCYTNRNMLQSMFYSKQFGTGKIPAGYAIYDLRISDDDIHYKLEDHHDWLGTPFTISGIRAYYSHLHNWESHSQLPDRPATVDIKGEELSYSDCKYCHLGDACDWATEPQAWMDQILKK
jgi:hypothetical protein